MTSTLELNQSILDASLAAPNASVLGHLVQSVCLVTPDACGMLLAGYDAKHVRECQVSMLLWTTLLD